jgi:DNA-binding XRE family transcriptional regulator
MKKPLVPLSEVMARFSPERRAKIEARTAELIAEELTLAELRKAQKLTQQKLAKTLGIKQESVSSIETRADMLLSTLRGYVKAVGGELSLKVTFPDRPPVELSTLRITDGKPIKRKAANVKSVKRGNRSGTRAA